ncbi:sensor histidine kinase [Tunturiibacter gelidoferens]|uniref:histidine kinase n=1 Tax=Tunturiibacter lichenicola TaxID=2051959 RepID=A0A7Y9NKU2_9BACT|nr:sensor histidine kinase [Edaphobacter lichenicola]NYF51211.1 signal transduction histidine kinase [Edaphobacter lichenicola]
MGVSFTVDTHVFRELGELLVARDSTALIELIKNSYDADATEVIVYGHSLSNKKVSFIQISDNGTGMTESAFSQGFLRIASRSKEQGDRRSLRFKRRFTGAKGIGRLAAHKLAEVLKVESIPGSEIGSTIGVKAKIDWALVEQYLTLEDLASEDKSLAVIVEPKPKREKSKEGTEIRLERLRRSWSDRELLRFVSEVQSFSPSEFLINPTKESIKPYSFLLQSPKISDVKRTAPFVSKLQGDFATGENYWPTFAASADWFIEIDAASFPNSIDYHLIPTVQFRKAYPTAKIQKHSIRRDKGKSAPSFQARIIVKEGQQGGGPLKEWAAANSGIRVFMEGFRVLPYGERSNDWLQLDRSYAERGRTSPYLTEFGFATSEEPDDRDALLSILPNRSYYGCIFLTQEGAPELEMLVNREGFIPNDSFESLVSLIRLGIDLSVRARAAAKAPKSDRAMLIPPPLPELPAEIIEPETLEVAVKSLSGVRELIAKGQVELARTALEASETRLQSISKNIDTESAMLRVLASVGSQMSAFVHEINAALGMAQGVEKSIERLLEQEFSAVTRRELNRALKSIADLRRQLERQASYLIDVNSPDARRRRGRVSISSRFDSAERLLQRVAEQKGVEIVSSIPEGLKSPPMFPAELTSVFTNLLTNAIKAANRGGKVSASGRAIESGGASVRIENTGIRVDLKDSERWFAPFESTTTSVDSVLGQGMGLGLTITRNILEQYDCSISFVKPSPPYTTAVEIQFAK